MFLVFLLCLPLFAAEKQLTVYAPHTTYIVAVRANDYVGLIDLLEPLGNVSTKTAGRTLKLSFGNVEGEFQHGSNRARLRGLNIELPASFRLENDRGFIPLGGLPRVLSALTKQGVEFHANALRLFLANVGTRYSIQTRDNALVFTFSAPVNPAIATGPGYLRMTFTREPLLASTPSTQAYPGAVITSCAFEERNGIAELTVAASASLLARFSDNGRTITVTALSAPAAPPQITTAAPSPPAPGIVVPSPSVAQPVVVLDAAHGGKDTGAKLAENLVEKDVTLAFARRLHKELEARGIATTLLRTGDVDMGLDQRASSANETRAPVFITLHASATGTGVRLFTTPADKGPKTAPAFVPWDDVQNAHIGDSRTLATTIATALLARDIPAQSATAPVRPLDNVSAAAVAIEISPGANASGGSLATAAYQESVCHTIAAAVAKLYAPRRSRP